MGQVTGVLYFRLNGAPLRVKEGSGKFDPGGFERPSQMAGSGRVGYTQKAVPAKVELTVIHMADTDILSLAGTVDADLEIQTDTGSKWLVPKATLTKPPELSEGEGEVTLSFEGDPAKKA
jgi:hypothetical protein